MTKYYHVWITLKGTTPPQRRRELERNLSFEDLETRFLIPYRTGRSLVVNGRTITPDELERVQVFETEQQLGHGVQIQWNMIPDVTNQFITGPPGSALESTPRDDQELRPPTDAQDVFVVHGRNSAAHNGIFGFLRSIGLHPLEWSEAQFIRVSRHLMSGRYWMQPFRRRTRLSSSSRQTMKRVSGKSSG